MSVISDSCKDLLEIVNDKRTRDQVFDECARNKMIRVYEREDEEYDKLLKTLEVNIDSCAHFTKSRHFGNSVVNLNVI